MTAAFPDPPAINYGDDNSHSRTSSVNSHSPSVQSAANSTRYMLAGMNNNSTTLEPPNAFGSRSSSFSRSMDPRSDVSTMGDSKTGIPTSLSVNYLPSKFSNTLIGSGMKRRKGKGMESDLHIPKRGGGREAFRANESRMPGDGDDDYDGVTFGGAQGGRKGRLRWNRFKWVLFVANTVVSLFILAHTRAHRTLLRMSAPAPPSPAFDRRRFSCCAANGTSSLSRCAMKNRLGLHFEVTGSSGNPVLQRPFHQAPIHSWLALYISYQD